MEVSSKLKLAWIPHQLTRDQKPCESDEKERILAAGGRIEAFKGKKVILNMDKMRMENSWDQKEFG